MKTPSGAGANSGSTLLMVCEKEISTASPRERSNPLHFIQLPIYTQVSHSAGWLSCSPYRLEKPVEKLRRTIRKRWLPALDAVTNVVRSPASAVSADDLGGGGRRNRTCGSLLRFPDSHPRWTRDGRRTKSHYPQTR